MRLLPVLGPAAALLLAACHVPRPINASDYVANCQLSADSPDQAAILFVSLRLPDCRGGGRPDLTFFRADRPYFGSVDAQYRLKLHTEDAWRAGLASQLGATTGAPIIYVHGYKSDQNAALSRSFAIRAAAPAPAPVVAITWPSYNSKLKYFWDEANAEWALVHARQLIRSLASSDRKPVVIAHSMGNRIALDALKSLRGESGEAPVAHIVMAAPDVDRDALAVDLRRAGGPGADITIYASAADQALASSWRSHGSARAGDLSRLFNTSDLAPPYFDNIARVEVVDLTAVRAEFWGHATFIETKAGAADLCRVLLSKDAPDVARDPVPNTSNYFRLRPDDLEDRCANKAAEALHALENAERAWKNGGRGKD